MFSYNSPPTKTKKQIVKTVKSIEENSIKCPKCSNEILFENNPCPECGYPEKNYLTSVLICSMALILVLARIILM